MGGEPSLTGKLRLSAGGEDESWPNDVTGTWPWAVRRHPHLWRPPTDVFETEDAYVVMVEVAGMREAEFSVTLDRQILLIRGLRAETPTAKAYHHMEIAYGEFATEVRLAVAIDASAIQAGYADGFLRVVLPKSAPKQISITG